MHPHVEMDFQPPYSLASHQKTKFQKDPLADFGADDFVFPDMFPPPEPTPAEPTPTEPTPAEPTSRQQTPYPQAENRREYTSRDPPAPKQAPRPKPRAKPRKAASPSPEQFFIPFVPPPKLTRFERLMKMSLPSVLREIVELLPGPKVEWATFKKDYPTVREQRRQMLLVRVF